MKKYIPVLLCISFLVSLLPGTARAAGTSTEDLDSFSSAAAAMASKYDYRKYIDDTEFSFDSDINVAFSSGVMTASEAKKICGIDPKNYLVSADALAEAADGSAEYDSSRKKLTISAGGGSVQMSIPGTRAFAARGAGPISGPVLNEGSAEVPLLETADKLGFTVVQTDNGMLLSYTYQSARLIVKASSKPEAEGALEIAGGYKGYYLIQYSTAEEAARAQTALSAQSCVEYVQADGVMLLEDTGSSDYSYMSWGPSGIGADSFNDMLLSRYGSTNAMPEVKVAVLDSGVDTDSSFLSGRLTDMNDGNDYNLINDASSIPEDDNGHGTHVSGIIADTCLPNVKIMPIKIGYANGTVNTSQAIVGVEKAVLWGAKIINMSFGGVGKYPALEDAINDAYAGGVLSVVSAGNDAADASNYSPADTLCALTVAALANKNSAGHYTAPYYSNYGSVIDLAAPGSGIVSTWLNNTVKSSTGTSMAAPFVSAAAAAAYTLAYGSATGTGPTAYQLTRMLCACAEDLGTSGWDEYYGYGMLNLKNFDTGTWQARIGDTVYASLSDAVNAASDGDTIELPWDLSLDASVAVSKNINVCAMKKLTINRASGFSGALFDVKSGGKLTLSGSEAPITISGDGQNGDSLVVVEASAALILSSGAALENNVCSDNGGAIKNFGTVTISGGTITGTSAAISGGGIYDAGELILGGSVNLGISGDIYLCTDRFIDIASSLSGGNIVAALTLQESGDGITAVRFAAGVTPDRSRFKLKDDNLDLAVSGQELVTAAAPNIQARIGDTEYATINQAFANAEDGDSITLIRNTNISAGITVNVSVTLSSPGGYVLGRDSSFKGNLLNVKPGVTLTLGRSDISDALVLDGGSTEVSGHIAEVSAADVSGGKSCGSLVINSGVTVRNFLGQTPKTTALISYGGAVNNNGSVTINGGYFTSSSGKAVFGAAIANWSGGSLTINDGTFAGNTGLYGGAIYNSGNTIINGGVFEKNETDGYKISTTYRAPNGGAIYNDTAGTMLIAGGTFSNNSCINNFADSSNSAGGCIYNAGSLTITGGLYYGNSGGNSYGGAAYNSGMLTLNGGIIQSNSSTLSGGGIYNASSLSIGGSTKVTDNTANSVTDNIRLASGKLITLTGDFTGKAGISSSDGAIAGTKFAEAASDTYTGFENFLPDSGELRADYLSDDLAEPYDIRWMTSVKSVEISGKPSGGETLKTLINGVSAPASGISLAWYTGSEVKGWTPINGETNSVLSLSRLEYVGQYIKVTVKGDRKTCTGTQSAVSSEAVAPFAVPPEATPAITAEYKNEKLVGFTVGSSYSINGGSCFTADRTELTISGDWFGTTLSIVKKSSGAGTSDSGAEKLALAPRPAAPAITGTEKVTAFTIAFPSTAGLEYSADGGAGWSVSNTFTGLTKNTRYSFEIRVKASAEAPCSLPTKLSVTTDDATDGALSLANAINALSGGSAEVSENVVTLEKDTVFENTLTVPENTALCIPRGITADVSSGCTLTSDGTIILRGMLTVADEALVRNSGTLDIGEDALIENKGTINNEFGASLISKGIISGDGRFRTRKFHIEQSSSNKSSLTVTLADMDDGFSAENGKLAVAQYDSSGRMKAVQILPYNTSGIYTVEVSDGATRASAFILGDPSPFPAFKSVSCVING